MAQVSKFIIRNEVWERIFDMFLDAFLASKNKDKLNGFVQSIFTPTERIMFAKRFAACVLLSKGRDYRSVARVLRMSPPTIAKMSFKLKYEGDGLVPVVEDILKIQAKSVFKEEIKDLLDLPTKSSIGDVSRIKRSEDRRKKIGRIKREF